MPHFKTHGMWNSRLYHIWKGMKQRCEDPKKDNYASYGGKGISVCEEWHDPCVFIGWALSHGYRDDLTIDRINNDKGYAPDNCRWVDIVTQSRNKTTNRVIEFNGEKRCLTEWSEITGIPIPTLWHRLEKGMSPEAAFCTPIDTKHSTDCYPVIIQFNGEIHTRKEWEEIMNLPRGIIRNRMYRGWSVEKALMTPARVYPTERRG